jgi:hypothetical protein
MIGEHLAQTDYAASDGKGWWPRQARLGMTRCGLFVAGYSLRVDRCVVPQEPQR